MRLFDRCVLDPSSFVICGGLWISSKTPPITDELGSKHPPYSQDFFIIQVQTLQKFHRAELKNAMIKKFKFVMVFFDLALPHYKCSSNGFSVHYY